MLTYAEIPACVQVMSQTTKMRETEMDKDQVDIKLNLAVKLVVKLVSKAWWRIS
jgi:hypothetical protein